MQLSPETPKLPKLPFIVGNLALWLTAWIVYSQAAKPLAAAPLVAITVLVATAAAALCYPFVADYAREQNAALDERQRSLEALAHTSAETAEQIGIAAAGLNNIAGQLSKSVQDAEHLPQQLQEKIAALDTRRATAASAEADALRAELTALRSAETAKLEAAAEKISRAATELTASDPSALKPSRAAKTAAPAANESSASGEPEPAAPVPAHAGSASSPVVVEAPAPQVSLVASAPAVSEAAATVSASTAPSPTSVAAALAAAEAMVRDLPPEEITETIAPFPMRPRPRPGETTPPVATEISSGPESGMLSPPPRRKRAKSAAPKPADDPDAASASQEPASDPAVPATGRKTHDTNPILELGISDDTPLSPEGDYPTAAVLSAPTAPPFAPRRRPAAPPVEAVPPAKPPTAAAPTEKPAAGDSEPAADTALASDGLTRLIVTAYIGIGNKLFLRGDGPGLRPDVGVPLQFVSIGKWRWETADATAPLNVKLYKNDRDPCPSPAAVTLQPGHQHEVSADF